MYFLLFQAAVPALQPRDTVSHLQTGGQPAGFYVVNKWFTSLADRIHKLDSGRHIDGYQLTLEWKLPNIKLIQNHIM